MNKEIMLSKMLKSSSDLDAETVDKIEMAFPL